MALAELHHLIEKEDRARAGVRFSFQQTEREVQNAAVILFAAHHLEGPARGRAGLNAIRCQSLGVTGDSTMTERDKGLNGRKVRIGRIVEAHMTLICGKVVTWFVGCRL